jgi:hypothetical protein
MSAPSISTVDDSLLVALIGSAKRRVMLVAPGVSLPVAEALSLAWHRLPASAVSVVLDVDPEVCRLGYGTEPALTHLQQTATKLGQTLCHEPGIRIALLIADDRTVIFSPTPLLIESQPLSSRPVDNLELNLGGSRAAPPKPNAIFLDTPPPALASDLGLTSAGEATRTVGLDPVVPAKIQALKTDLTQNPPMSFDIARYERVFNAQIEFVELSVIGCSVSKHTAPIPSDLMGLAHDEKTRQRLRSSFKIIGEHDAVDAAGTLSEKTIHDRRKQISDTYLRSLKGYGVAILRTNRSAFEKEIVELESMVAAFAEGLKVKLDAIISRNVAALVEALVPAVEKNPPRRWTAILGPAPKSAACRTQLAADLVRIFGDADDLVREMKVSLIFKGVTYQTLTKPDFIEIAAEQFPNLRLMDEYEAARGRGTKTK